MAKAETTIKPEFILSPWEVEFITAFREFASESRTVNKRDGSTVEYSILDIPAMLFANMSPEAVDEYLRDSSSAALSIAFAVANPNNKDEGKALIKARNEWVGDNVDAVAKESGILMTDARDRLYKGERRVMKGSTVDPLDVWRIKVIRAEMRVANGAGIKKAYDAIDSGDTKARREYLQSIAVKNADWVDPKAVALKAASDKASAELATGLKKITL